MRQPMRSTPALPATQLTTLASSRPTPSSMMSACLRWCSTTSVTFRDLGPDRGRDSRAAPCAGLPERHRARLTLPRLTTPKPYDDAAGAAAPPGGAALKWDDAVSGRGEALPLASEHAVTMH